MRYLLVILAIVVHCRLYAQDEPSAINADRLEDAAIEIERFAIQQNRASALYFVGGAASLAAITFVSSQPQVAVGLYAVGGVLGLTGWVIDRSSYPHLETAGRLLQRVSIPMEQKEITNTKTSSAIDSITNSKRDSLIQATAARDSQLNLIKTEMDEFYSKLVLACKNDELSRSFCLDFEGINDELNDAIKDAIYRSISTKVILQQVKSAENEVNNYLSDVYFSSSKERDIAQSYRITISRLKAWLLS